MFRAGNGFPPYLFYFAEFRILFYNVPVSSNEIKYPPQFVIEACRIFSITVSTLLWGIKFTGHENIPDDDGRGLLVAPNHQTYIDPVWVATKIHRKMCFMAWDEVFEWFLIGPLIKYLGAFPVEWNRRGYVKASRTALKLLKQGATLIMFPEGERSFSNGQMHPFKDGVVRLAMEADVPILPVTIKGGNEVWGREMSFPRLGKVEIIYHPVINVPRPAEKSDMSEYVSKYNAKLAEIITSG